MASPAFPQRSHPKSASRNPNSPFRNQPALPAPASDALPICPSTFPSSFAPLSFAPLSFVIRPLLLLLAIFLFTIATVSATTFPLEIPKRPTSFPLQRPTQVGEVVAWGSNTFGQVTIPTNASNIVAISAGRSHNLALRSDGAIVAWGDNSSGQCTVPSSLGNVVAISAGNIHSMALCSDGSVAVWGGIRNVSSSAVETVAIAAGQSECYALSKNGSVISWDSTSGVTTGFGWTNIVSIKASYYYGCLAIGGDGLAVASKSPTLFFPLTQIARIGTGTTANTPLIKSDGVILRVPDYPSGLRAAAVAHARATFAAISGDSSIVAWTFDTTLPFLSPPIRLRGVIDVDAGEYHFLALKLPIPPIPTTATASAQIVNGFIVGLNVLDGGEGYAEPPKVTITGGGGSGAQATAQISKGVVTGFKVISAGSDYTSQPTITIDPPPILPLLSIAPSRVNVVSRVVPGKRYQLESSNDLPNFAPVGSPFTAAAGTITNEFTIAETGQFFRIQEVP